MHALKRHNKHAHRACGAYRSKSYGFLLLIFYNTRSAVRGNLYQPKSRLHITEKSFASVGVKVWNALPISLRLLNKHSFTTRCKIILINTMMACDDYVDFAKILQTVPGIKCN